MKQLMSILFIYLSFMPALVRADKLDDVLAMPHRETSRVRDVYRHPRQTLDFFQVQPDQKILEIWPGGGWYTEILSPLMRGSGELTLAQYSPDATNTYYTKAIKKLDDKLKAKPGVYDQVRMAVFFPPDEYALGGKDYYDRILTFRNLHNWLRNGEDVTKTIFKQFYQALKPGGMLGFVEHRYPEERQENAKGGYVKQSYVIKLAESAGFKLVGSSEINANPKDIADYPKGVWTLPPTLSRGKMDRDKYLAIGESDRMTLLFKK